MPRARCEVVEHVLLCGESPGVVPLLAILTAAAQVRHGEHTALLAPQQPGRVQPRFERDAEAAAPGEQGRSRAVAAHVWCGHKGHRHLRAVSGGRELAAHLVAREVERSLIGEPRRPRLRAVSHAPPNPWAGERLEGVNQLVRVERAEAFDRADRRHVDPVEVPTVGITDAQALGPQLCILSRLARP